MTKQNGVLCYLVLAISARGARRIISQAARVGGLTAEDCRTVQAERINGAVVYRHFTNRCAAYAPAKREIH